MRTEISAGGVVYRKKGKTLQILLLRDKNNNWTFPKGLIEDNEEEKITAQREINEEVGISKLELRANLTPIGYYYKWQNDLIKKTVYYFLFNAIGNERPKPQKEEGITAVKWFAFEKALEIIGYPKTNKPILQEVKEIWNGMMRRTSETK